MRPLQYVDFEILGQGAGAPAPVIASRLFRLLHGVFAATPGKYALALPGWGDAASEAPGFPFRVLRVFAATLDELARLVDSVSSHAVVRDYARIGFPRAVPEGFSGPWVELRRYRISSRKAGVNELRMRRIKAADKHKLPFFQHMSQSTGQAFGLTVEPRPSTGPINSEVVPDTYGLSAQSRAFALPHIPLG